MARLDIDPIALNGIMKVLEKKSNSLIKRKLNSSYYQYEKKFNKWRSLFAIKLALDYLSPYDKLINVLLVCKRWKLCLEKKIYKIALSRPDERLKLNWRLKLWISAIKLVSNLYNFYHYNTFIRILSL